MHESDSEVAAVMNVTLEQARCLDALARHGTLEAAGRSLHKVHTAVLYAVRALEEQTGLTLLDRSGYRNRLTPAGQRVLEHCRRLLAEEQALADACVQMRTGWEPSLRVVFDGIFPVERILRGVMKLRRAGAPTRVQVSVDYLGGVERRFEEEQAELMLSLLPASDARLSWVALPRLRARLVAHRSFPLARAKEPLSNEALGAQLFLSVRGSDPRLMLSTAQLEQSSTVLLSDFHAKRAAILSGMGFGWLPEWMVHPELASGELVTLRTRGPNTHAFQPRLYHRSALGEAAQAVVRELRPSRRPQGV